MRKSITATLALAALLSFAAPTAALADARPARTHASARENREFPPLKILVKLLQRAFGIGSTAEPIVPIPAPSTGTGTGS